MSKKKINNNNSVRRSVARGTTARGTSALPDSGREAFSTSRKSYKGTYRVEFTELMSSVSEKDIEIRLNYGKGLVANHIGVPADMVTLRKKANGVNQTVTALDEVYYVKVGKDTAGKLSIRTQRLWKNKNILFIFQKKVLAPKPPQKSFSRKTGYKKRTSSQKGQARRKSYNKNRHK